jgi:cyclopropane fatty-acyl-phospholipid synthase-like methyltransferase
MLSNAEDENKRKRKRRTDGAKSPDDKAILSLYRDYVGPDTYQSLINMGSTTTISYASLKKLLAKMKVTKDSVLLDIGCGSGIPCVVAARLLKCKCYGFDVKSELVAQASKNAADLGVSSECTFEDKDALTLSAEWMNERNITHVYYFDSVFPVKAHEHAIKVLSSGKKELPTLLTVANNWKDHIGGVTVVDQVTATFSPRGSSSRTFYIQNRCDE